MSPKVKHLNTSVVYCHTGSYQITPTSDHYNFLKVIFARRDRHWQTWRPMRKI